MYFITFIIFITLYFITCYFIPLFHNPLFHKPLHIQCSKTAVLLRMYISVNQRCTVNLPKCKPTHNLYILGVNVYSISSFPVLLFSLLIVYCTITEQSTNSKQNGPIC